MLSIYSTRRGSFFMENADHKSDSIQQLLRQVEDEPNNWGVRKKAALMLYGAERYLEAADVLWKAPEMPATDVDVAFSVKIVSRARPNRSIRLIYEVLRRNEGKAVKNVAMARALNMIGMPMLATRFYGAATAEDPDLFDLSFEKQMLWFDDSGRLLEEWGETDQEAKPPLSVPLQDFAGDMIDFEKLAQHAGENDEGESDLEPKVGTSPSAPTVVPTKAKPPGAPTTPLVMPKPLPSAGAPRANRPDDVKKGVGGSGAAVRKPDVGAPGKTSGLLKPGQGENEGHGG